MLTMTLARKSIYVLLAYLALTFILAATVPSFIHRRNRDKAYFTWMKSPTPQNEAAFREQQRINDLIHLADSAIGALVLMTLSLGSYGVFEFAFKRLRRSEHNGS